MDISTYMSLPEWDLISTGAKKNVMYYPCCAEPYPDVTFNITMRRRPAYYMYHFVGPALLLALLTPFIFLLPHGQAHKLALGEYTI